MASEIKFHCTASPTGHVEVQAVLGDETRTRMKAVRALVDTGATLTAIPRQLARELGIKPHAQARVQAGAGVIVMDRARASSR
jgi:predicted aspartyl protease